MGRLTRSGRRRTAASGHGKRASLADALFTATQQRVLGLLFGQPDRSFYATEIIRMTRSGSGAVQRELARLAQSGLAVVTRVGNQKHYQANPSAPVFGELRGIVMKTSGHAEPLRAALVPLAKRIRLALVYGSVARGEARAESDIDLLIVAAGLSLEQLFRCLAPVEKTLGSRVHPTLYTPEEFRRRRMSKNPFLEKVLDGEHLLLMGSEDAAGAAR